MISKADANKKSQDPLERIHSLREETADLDNAATDAASYGIRSNDVASTLTELAGTPERAAAQTLEAA